jgi:hypothetical protein
MLRFIKNRRMALILALVACLAASPFVASIASAGQMGDEKQTDPQGGGQSKGDPDMPVGPSRSNGLNGVSQQRQATSMRAVRPVGDGTTAGLAWVWQIRIVLQSVRAYTLRF